MFDKASRLKLRFETGRGTLSHEDLWDLPLAEGVLNLNDMAKALRRKVKASEEEDFVTTRSAENELTALRFDIVKHIIDVRLVDRRKRQQIMEVLERKEDKE